MPPKAKTSWADLPDLTVSVSWNLIRRSMKVGEGMMEPPPVNHSTHPTKQGSTEDKAGAKKKKKPEPENPKLSSKLAAATNDKVLTWLQRMEQDMLAEYEEEEDVVTIDSD